VTRPPLPRHLPSPRLVVRPYDGPASLAAGLRAVETYPWSPSRTVSCASSRGLTRCWETTDRSTWPTTTRSGPSFTSERGVYERLCLEGFQAVSPG